MGKIDSLVKNKFVLAILLVVLFAALAVYINTLTGFFSFGPVISVPEKQPTLTSYFGNAPIIDGQVFSLDRWSEADSSTITYERGAVTIASKHDDKHIYFLVQWDDQGPAWNDAVKFYVEDDGVAHDHFLDGKYDYSFGNLGGGCTTIGGGSWTEGANDWTPAGANFDISCLHEKGKWTMEIKHVLSDALRGDKVFSISTSKEELLGFALVNWENGALGGQDGQSWSWPTDQKSGALYGTVPNEPATWGDLKVVWNKKVKKA